jgi:hypothetical protein
MKIPNKITGAVSFEKPTVEPPVKKFPDFQLNLEMFAAVFTGG